MILSCINIKKSFVNELIKNASLTVADGEKVGLLGINGSGKSTLFKIIIGETPKDSGDVLFKSNTKVGYLSQHMFDDGKTIYEELLSAFEDLIKLENKIKELTERIAKENTDTEHKNFEILENLLKEFEINEGYLYESRLRGVINGLGFKEDMLIKNLSGGQKTTLSMAKLLLSNNNILLLDEPTNHLDLKSVLWLEEFLKDYKGAVVLISHDRYFINKICTKIVEIENGITTTYNGNYDFFVEKKAINFEILQKHYENQQKEIKKVEDSIALLKSFNREKSVKRARSKEKSLEKIDRINAPLSAPQNLRLFLTTDRISGNEVLKVRDLSLEPLFKNLNFDIRKGERVALVGPVGIGKTTLFKTILQNTDNIIFGSKVDIAFYEQHQEDALNINNNIFEEIQNTYPYLKNGEIRSTLALFTFTGDDIFKKISSLSGGERAKVLLCKIMLSGSNFLMLDEPTNHLDITSKEVLEEALNNFNGTCFFISHDRYFINRVATRVIELNRNITEYLGNYDYYIEKKSQKNNQNEEISHNINNKLDEKKINAENRAVQKLQDAEKRKIQNKIKSIEKNIVENEEKIKELDIKLQDAEIQTDHVTLSQIFKEKEETENLLLELYVQLEDIQK
ncbi:MAG: ATP-binding cassette domain-containing protein [Defluviitaleaceae bacterium]|nr:ATP-binding cassette domain-containing protein [Defluviitaleaceae bacterium]